MKKINILAHIFVFNLCIITSLSAFHFSPFEDVFRSVNQVEDAMNHEFQSVEKIYGRASGGKNTAVKLSFDENEKIFYARFPQSINASEIKTIVQPNMCQILVHQDNALDFVMTIKQNKYSVVATNQRKKQKSNKNASEEVASSASIQQSQTLPYIIDLQKVSVTLDKKNAVLEIALPPIAGTTKEQHIPVRER